MNKMAVDLGTGDLVMLRLEYSDENDLSDTSLNVLYYQVKSITVEGTGLPAAIRIPVEAFAVAFANAGYGIWANLWKQFASEDSAMTGASVQKVRGEPRSTLYHYTPLAPTQGVQLGDALPMQDSVTLLKQTGIGQRWGMGRMFVPGIPELHAEGGRVTAAAMDNLAPLAANLASTFLVSDGTYNTLLNPVLWCPEKPHEDPPVAERITVITRGTVSDDIIKTQRRRRPGKGS